jgi:hypothetical protein
MAAPSFRRGSAADYFESSPSHFLAADLPDEQKRDICRGLLAEFGVTNISQRADEFIHSCCLPFGAHGNGDRNPSASLNWAKLTYNCLGCGNSGGLLWFIGVCRGEDSAGARRWMEGQLGLTDDPAGMANLMRHLEAIYDPTTESRPPIPRMDASLLDKWRFVHPWVTEVRRIPIETVQRFDVGYGIVPLRVGNSTVHSERITIPHFWKGNLVGWQSRRLAADGTPKYQSSPDFPKDTTIYNYDRLRPTAVVTESPFSVLSKYHCRADIVATFGAKVTDAQIRLLANHERIILFLDNDDAGWAATTKLIAALSGYAPVTVVDNPYAADPADMDDATFLGLLDGAVPYPLWKPPGTLREWHEPEEALR